MRGARIYLILTLVLAVLFVFVFLRSCRSGDDPHRADGAPDQTTVSALALPDFPVA